MTHPDWTGSEKRSTSGTWVEYRESGDILWVLKVAGLGAIVMRAGSDAETGRLIFNGVSTFSNAQIGLWE